MQLGKAMALLATAWIAAQSGAAVAAKADDEAAIRNALLDGCAGFVNKDLARATALYSPDLYIFNSLTMPHNNLADLLETNRQEIGSVVGTPTCTYRDMYVKVYGDNAYARYFLSIVATHKSGAKIDVEGRGTNIFERINGEWKVVHEHFSLPTTNPVTGQTVLKSDSKN